MCAELKAEKIRQKGEYDAKKARKEAEFDSIPNQQEKFQFPRFKLDDKKIKEIKEKYQPRKLQINQTFLSNNTANGLRVTCKSTNEL